MLTPEGTPVIVVRVTPANDMRRAFAEWAVEQVPKIRTISSRSFAVPPGQFTHVPEYLLIGAMVDGHPYVPAGPEEEPEPVAGAVAPAHACPGVCGGRLPDLPAEAYPAGAVLLDLVGVDDPAAEEPPAPEADAGDGVLESGPEADALPGPACPDPLCGRTFASPRGLATHRRQAHAENED